MLLFKKRFSTYIHQIPTSFDRAYEVTAQSKGQAVGKVFKNALIAIGDMKDGASIMAGGFGLCGIPENLIKATAK